MKSTRRRAASVKKSTRTPTLSSVRRSIPPSTASSASRSWPPASIPQATIDRIEIGRAAALAADDSRPSPAPTSPGRRPSPAVSAAAGSSPDAATRRGRRDWLGHLYRCYAAGTGDVGRCVAAPLKPQLAAVTASPELRAVGAHKYEEARMDELYLPPTPEADRPLEPRMPEFDELAAAGCAESDPRPTRRRSAARAAAGGRTPQDLLLEKSWRRSASTGRKTFRPRRPRRCARSPNPRSGLPASAASSSARRKMNSARRRAAIPRRFAPPQGQLDAHGRAAPRGAGQPRTSNSKFQAFLAPPTGRLIRQSLFGRNPASVRGGVRLALRKSTSWDEMPNFAYPTALRPAPRPIAPRALNSCVKLLMRAVGIESSKTFVTIVHER